MRNYTDARIYVLDNDQYNLLLINELLKEAGFRNTQEFLKAESLLRKLGEDIPDIILSDIMMPEMNGYQLCEKVKSVKEWRNVPIIMITAADMHNSEPLRQSFEAGASDFLKKPIDEIELVMRIKNALKVEWQRQELQKALSEVKTLQGLLPICSYCKKIRDDKNYWQEIESYIASHSSAEFSHSICPDCMEKHIKPQMEELEGE